MRRTLIAVTIALAGALGLLSVAPPHASAAEGYGETGTSVYRLDPAKGVLRVTVTLKVTNRTPDKSEPYSCIKYTGDWFPIPYPSTCYRTTRYYMTTTSAIIENEAAALKAVSGGKRLKVSEGTRGAYYRGITVTFPKLFFGKTRTVKLTYTVKGGAPRSDSTTRTMRAYASFCTIANGADGASVTIRMPAGFEVDTTGKKLRSQVAGKERVFTSRKITDPASWYACLTGTNKAGYKTAKLDAQGRTIALRSWPEDPAWAKGVRADIASGLPMLERLTGTALHDATDLSVQESSTGTEYAGFYEPDTGTVTVGEDFRQPSLVQHELAHVWFNGSAFKETWISEGFAEWAGRAVSGEEGACARPEVTTNLQLAEWRYLGPRSTPEERQAVAGQYEAACHVITAVANAAGDAGMTTAISALLARRDPYAADATASRERQIATWRDWLDAMDELALAPAGAPEGLASDLLLEYGAVTDRSLLAQRAAARRAYHELAASVDGWTVPAVIRTPLARWDFAAAGTAIEAAGRTWERTGETDAVLEGVDARHGPAADTWERATTVADLDAAADLAQRQLVAARDVADVRRLVDQPLDLVQQVGMFGTQVPTPEAAIPAVRAGDGDAAARITADVRATLASLRASGQQRIAVGGVTLVALSLLLGFLLVRRTRAASARRANARLAAATVAMSGAHAWPPVSTADPVATRGPATHAGTPGPAAGPPPVTGQPWSANPLDDDTTHVWLTPIVPSDADPDLGALVRPARRPDRGASGASGAPDGSGASGGSDGSSDPGAGPADSGSAGVAAP